MAPDIDTEGGRMENFVFYVIVAEMLGIQIWFRYGRAIFQYER